MLHVILVIINMLHVILVIINMLHVILITINPKNKTAAKLDEKKFEYIQNFLIWAYSISVPFT